MEWAMHCLQFIAASGGHINCDDSIISNGHLKIRVKSKTQEISSQFLNSNLSLFNLLYMNSQDKAR